MKIPFEDELAEAVRIVADAAERIHQRQHTRRVGWKTDHAGKQEIVTDLDVEVNAHINREIAIAFPKDLVAGEELSRGTGRGGEKRVWLVDPIDGTRSFVNNVHGYSMMISFLHEAAPCFAVVHDVMKRETIVAHHRLGVRKVLESGYEEIPRPVAPSDSLLWNPFVTSDLEEFLMSRLGLSSTYEVESTGLRAIAMARGKGKLFLSFPRSSKIWDSAPAFLIVRALGGEYTDFAGNALKFAPEAPINRMGTVASFDLDHQRVLDVLASYQGRL